MGQLNWSRARDQCIVALCCVGFAYAGLWLLGHVLRIMLLILLALVLANALDPFLSRLERVMPRSLGVLVIYAGGLALAAVIGFLFGQQISAQAQGLGQSLPAMLDQAGGYLSTLALNHGIPVPWIDHTTATDQVTQTVQGGLKDFLGKALNLAALLANGVVDMLLVLVMGFYFMAGGPGMRRAFIRLFPQRHQDKAAFVASASSAVLGSYIRGQLILAAIIGVGAGLGCALLGVRYPLAIAVFAFVFELIPMVGPVLSAIPAVFIALFQPFPLVVWVILFFVALQMFENHILAPRIQGHAVGIHPVLALIALVLGADLFGVFGALLAVPTAGILSVLLSAGWSSWKGEAVEMERGGVKLRLPRRRRKEVA